ncbi:MAG: peptidylprolyl isomerase [Hyphomicrobiaceae bacterium]
MTHSSSTGRDRPLSRVLMTTALAACAVFASVVGMALAEDKVVARINGKPITEADLKYAETEIGSELGQLPPTTKRRVLVEFLVENQLMADAAESQSLTKTPAYESRLAYWRRKALRDTYFERAVEGAITDEDARKFYDEQVGKLVPEEQVKARHILVKDEEKAKEIAEALAHDGDFAKLAKENSQDPGSKDNGGELGWVKRGQTVPEFEEALFKLKRGETSQPVKSQFGWHVIRADETKAEKPTPPPFEQLKPRLKAALVHRKAQAVVAEMRGKATVELVDPELKAFDEQQKAAAEKAAKDKAGAAKPAEPKKP